jgi:hypothetical protein
VIAPEVYILTHAIAEADSFLDFVRTSGYGMLFHAVHDVRDYEEVVEKLADVSYDSIFVEDDRVSLYHVIAPLKRKYLSIFEEGTGTYVGDYREQLSGLRRLRWQVTSVVTGCGLRFGEGRRTDYVIVQHPEAFARLNPNTTHKVLPASPLRNELAHLAQDWDAALAASGVGWPQPEGHVALVLGTWGGVIDESAEQILDGAAQVYYKAHPHDGIVPQFDAAEVIAASWIPAEVYIDRFAAACRLLTVYHFSSTVQLNMGYSYPNVRFVDLLRDPQVVEVQGAVAAMAKDAGGKDA